MKRIMLLIFCALLNAKAQQTPDQQTSRMQWFQDAKLGIFIHWGIYAVNGIDESWSFYNGYISYDDYMKQLGGFTAAAFSPAEWAELIAGSGAKYAVLTSKHHDGVALWPTRLSDLNVSNRTPAGRDLLAPFVKAIRNRGLKAGIYFSHLDWSHPDYPLFTGKEKRYDPAEQPDRWRQFLAFRKGQIRELAKEYKPDLFWFDGDWDFPAHIWESQSLRDSIFHWLPQVILNSRINGYGDYSTPEQGVPITRPQGPWELCMTMNDSWGYQHHDRNYKTAYQIIRIFADCISMGGNLLLDIGPMADGTIPDEQKAILKELGRWTGKHKEAIYGTRPGLPPGHFYGPSTQSCDSQTLYLFLPHPPKGPVLIKGLKNPVQRIRVVGNGTKLAGRVIMKQYWSAVPGILSIDVPQNVLDSQMTVLALLLQGPLEIYREDSK